MKQFFKVIFYSIFFLSFSFYSLANILTSGAGMTLVGPATITQPGIYKLGNNFSGTIVIDADNVILDLNKCKLSANPNDGITVIDHNNIVIRNGSIEGANSRGIEIIRCSNVDVSDIEFINDNDGIFALTVTALRVSHCLFRGQPFAESLGLFDANDIVVTDCAMTQNESAFIIRILNSYCLTFKDIIICNNIRSLGIFFVIEATNVQNALFSNIKIDQNQVLNDEFRCFNFDHCNDIECIDCSCSKNICLTSGFVGYSIVNDSRNFMLNNCLVNNNAGVNFNGINFDEALRNAVINNCQSNGNIAQNTFTGFCLNGFSSAQFNSCLCNNNQSANSLRPVFISNGRNVAVNNCQADNNDSVAETNIYFVDNNGKNVRFSNCTANQNNCLSNLRVYRVESSNEVFFTDCMSNSNTTTIDNASIEAFAVGLNIENIFFDRCFAVNNNATGANSEFLVANNIQVSNSVVNQNFGTVSSSGFFLHALSSTVLIRNCTAKNNMGAFPAGFNNNGSNNVLLENIAQNHGLNGSRNFAGVPARLITTLDPTTDWTSTVTPFNNISVTMP